MLYLSLQTTYNANGEQKQHENSRNQISFYYQYLESAHPSNKPAVSQINECFVQ